MRVFCCFFLVVVFLVSDSTIAESECDSFDGVINCFFEYWGESKKESSGLAKYYSKSVTDYWYEVLMDSKTREDALDSLYFVFSNARAGNDICDIQDIEYKSIAENSGYLAVLSRVCGDDVALYLYVIKYERIAGSWYMSHWASNKIETAGEACWAPPENKPKICKDRFDYMISII